MQLIEIQTKLKERVAKGLNFGMEAVEEVIDPGSDLYNEYVLLKSQYNDLMYLSALNTLPYEQIEIGLNRLRSSILGLINKLEMPALQKGDLPDDLKIRALPTRRDNFFKLLDIHFKNLEAISFVETSGDDEDRYDGRQAVYNYYRMHVRQFQNKENRDSPEVLAMVQQYFADYFGHEIGILEVYFKNIKHLLAYALDSEVEQQFFLDTLRSLFSRYELGLIFYYALSQLDVAFNTLVLKARLIQPDIQDILVSKTHFQYLHQLAEPD
jgi:hypothetical protein